MAKKRILVFIFIVLAAFSVSCTNHRERRYLSISMSAGPIVLNPILSVDSASSEITDLVYNGLIKIDPHLNVVPDLADTWIIKNNGLTYVFKLKRGVKWQDGYNFTAYDVKFTYDKIMDTRTQTVRREMFEPFSSFSAPDSYTFIATLNQPYAPAIQSFGMGILPRHLFKNVDINNNRFNNHPIGTGSYKFVEWRRGQYVKLTANADYYEHKPYIDTIIFEIIPDEAVSIMKLEKGDIDIAGIQPQDVSRIRKNKGIRIYLTDQLAYTYIAFNLKRKIFQDKRVRQGLSYLIDKKKLVKYILSGYGQVATGPIPPVSWAYNPDVKRYNYDPEKGLQLLAAAGYKTRNTSGELINSAGTPLKFTLVTNQGNNIRKQVAEYIQSKLRKYGINIDVRIIEWSGFIKKYIAPRDFDAVLMGWGLGVDPDQYAIWHSSQILKGFNFIGYSNKKVDKLLERGRRITDKAERKTIYWQIQRLIALDEPYIFLYYPQGITGINRRVDVVKPSRFSLMYHLIDWKFLK